jgi:hypothetical protein
MKKVVIKETAIRELIKEAFDNVDTFIEVPEEEEVVVNVDPSVQSEFVATDLDPVEPQFEPCDKIQFSQGIEKMLEDVPSDVIPNLYKKVEDVIAKEMNAYAVSREQEGAKDVSVNKTMNIGELRNLIKKVIDEATRFSIAGHKYSDEDVEQEPAPSEPEEELPGYEYSPIEDYDDEEEDEELDSSINSAFEDDEDEEEEPNKGRKQRQELGVGHGWASEGESLEKIAKDIGYSTSGIKKIEGYALKKLNAIITTAVPKYIAYLNSSGELTPEDTKLLRRNPAIVADLPGFKDYLKDLMKKDADEDEEV